MDEKDKVLFMCSGVAVIAAFELMQRNQKRQHRRWWRTNIFRKRMGNELLQVLKAQQISGQYKNFTRMSPTTFEDLLVKIGPRICKKETNMRETISVQDR